VKARSGAQEDSVMKVFGHPMSTCTRKVLTTLAEKGQPAEFVMVDIMKGEHKQPAHLARQPFGVVPVFEDDDGFQVYESRAIIRYLDGRLQGTALTPGNHRDRGRMEQWISVEHSYFTPTAMKIIYQVLFYPMSGKGTDQAVVDAARGELSRVLDVVEKNVADKPFLAGETFSLADICYMPYVEYLFAGQQGDLITARPGLAGWWERVSSRPSWKKATGKSAA
jgi:glutathione S-transferase